MRKVCGCTPASSAATEITNKALLSGFSIAAPSTRARAGLQRRARIVREHRSQRLDCAALLVGEFGGHLHVDRDKQRAAVDAALGHTERLVRRCARRDLDRDALTVDGGHAYLRANRGFCERHG